MLKFILFSLLFVSSQALGASLEISMDAFDNQPNDCPMFDDSHKLEVEVRDSNNNRDTSSTAMINISISCSTAGAAATVRYTTSGAAQQGVAMFDITPEDRGMLQKDTCTVTASATGITSDTYNFTVGFQRVGPTPPAEVSSAIVAGKSFNIVGLDVHNDHVPFYDLLLRECTASSDPWVFWYDESDSGLHRVYPTPTDLDLVIDIVDIDNDGSDNECMGRYDGALKNMFTIGSNYDSCQLKLVKANVTGGNSFALEGVPVLASTVAVTLTSGNIMVNTGAKPADPTGIIDTIVVYVSTNAGFSWTKSTSITSWTTSATNSGVSTTNPDNTRNMAMLKITDNTSTWWRLVRGQ